MRTKSRRRVVGILAAPIAFSVGLALMPLAQPAATHHTMDYQLAAGESDYGLVVGATFYPDPPPSYVNPANALYLQPNGFVFTGANIEPVRTPQTLALDSAQTGANLLAARVTEAAQTGENLYIFGYSQGAELTHYAARALAEAGVVDPSTLHFALVGDTANPYGGYLTMFGFNPSIYDSLPGGEAFNGMHATEYILQYDGLADYPQYVLNPVAVANGVYGMFMQHNTYLSLTPADLAAGNTFSVGDVTYHQIPTDVLPILSPLLWLGPLGQPTYDLLQPVTQVLVDLGYGHLDEIVDGQVIATGFNDVPADGSAVVANFGFPDVSFADLSDTLNQAVQLGIDNYLAALTGF